MRDIKFRVWLPSLRNGVMSYFSVAEEFALTTDSVVMQFTGLKDKNGEEIYEGDIINDDNPDGGDNGKVVWDKEHWAIEWGKNELDYFADYHIREFMVIGNIYETPNLLP